jgi:phosphonate transport system substrate-binding protein
MHRSLMAVAAAALVATTTFAKAQTEINFGVISTEASMNQKKNWEPFLTAMSSATGLKINGFYATDYAGVIEAMRFSKVHLAWYGNKSGMEAVDRASGEVFAQIIARNGSDGYYSHVIVHKDSPFKSVEDILKCDKSIDFGIGDPNSTSGFLVPISYIFAAKGIEPKSCFKTVRNANHQANAMAVANKQVAAATNNSEDLLRVGTTSPDARANIKVIWTSPLIPLDPLTWRKDLDPAVKTKIYTFMLSYGRVGSPDEIRTAKEVLANLVWSPFRPSSNDQLLPIRKLEATKNLMRVESDEKLSAGDKAKQVAALKADIAKLDEQTRKAGGGEYQQRVARFMEADKAGNQAELKKMIAEFAAGFASTN